MVKDGFEQGPIRPPDEAESLLIRTTRGCPWNRCAFCTLYRDVQFSVRPVEEIKQDIFAAREYYQGHPFETCFLQDGDSFVMRTKDLIEILKTLKEAFPSLKRISSYGRAQTMVKKSASAMGEICDAGLNMLYCGMESGSRQVLENAKKGITPEAIITSSLNAKNAGMEMAVFTILGLGGKELSSVHVEETARILNRIDPEDIRILSLGVKPGTDFEDMISGGSFTLLTEVEMIREQRQLLSLLEGIHGRYGNYHCVNLLTEVKGRLPEDKMKFLSVFDRFLSLSPEDQLIFTLGRRLGHFHGLTDFRKSFNYESVQKQVEKIQQTAPASFDTLFHDLRRGLI